MTTYLIPMVTNGETLVLEYKVETCKKDMRLKFRKKTDANMKSILVL